jgi:hypothetical protein
MTKTATERYPSGLRGWFAKSLEGRKFLRGFESLSLRHINKTYRKIGLIYLHGMRLGERRLVLRYSINGINIANTLYFKTRYRRGYCLKGR